MVTNPELIGLMPLSAKVAVVFMFKGLYTGKKLEDYFNDKVEDWVNARRIINGIDKAAEIAAIAQKFYECLK